jgi:hypothetical protein
VGHSQFTIAVSALLYPQVHELLIQCYYHVILSTISYVAYIKLLDETEDVILSRIGCMCL